MQEGEELPARVKEDKALGVQKAGTDLRDALDSLKPPGGVRQQEVSALVSGLGSPWCPQGTSPHPPRRALQKFKANTVMHVCPPDAWEVGVRPSEV